MSAAKGQEWGLAVLAALASLTWAFPVRADDAPPVKGATAPTEKVPIVKGWDRCDLCHRAGKLPKHKGLQPLCLCTEETRWLHNDKHQDAFTVLDPKTNPRAKSIAELLGKNFEPQREPDCLGCHSMYSVNPKAKDLIGDLTEEGVSCIACHGAYDNWIDIHGSTDEDKRRWWRSLDRKKDKEDKYFMTDLWDPARRTEVCASCHIGDGDPEKHRFVTHEMYAAGHPPLPAFDTAAFCNSLPRHWQLMNEKDLQVQHDLKWAPRELEQTKLAVVGEAAAFREAMNLLAMKAKKTPENEGLDFALFDCSSCHHDLKQPSWRQKTGYEGTPGRPGLRRWSPAALDLGLWHAGEAEDGRKKLQGDLDARMTALRDEFNKQPYGNAEVGTAAAALATWADKDLLPLLNPPAWGDNVPTRYTTKDALNLLRRLAQDAADPGRGKTPGYDGTRQTAWAFDAIYDDLSRTLKQSKDAEDMKTWAALQDKQAAIQEQRNKLDAALNLTLPNAKGISEEDYAKDEEAAKNRRLAQVLEFLPGVLKQKADYEPGPVQKAFAELAKLLP